VTTSASSLDPPISPQFALAQVPAVAKARNLNEGRVRGLSKSISSRARWAFSANLG
jgi:potassium-transporting ATPase KdpC subunit